MAYRGEIGCLARSFDSMATVIEREESKNRELIESLRALTARLDSVGEEERSRIAREIHDELGQQLTAMKFELLRLRQAVECSVRPESLPAVQNRFEDLTALVEASIRDVRRIATELRPVILADCGLAGAIEWLAADFRRHTGIECSLRIPDDIQGGGDFANCVFRICQESLTNVARHAHPAHAIIRIEVLDEAIAMTISDDGWGFDPATHLAARSLGVVGMRERARIAGGQMELTSAPGQGTTVSVWLPLSPAPRPDAPSPESVPV